jgi:hypothetical protein
MNLGHIVETRHEGPLGSRWYSYRLEGGPYYGITRRVLCHISPAHTNVGDVVTVGPFRFRLVEYAPWIGGYYCVLDGSAGTLRYWWHRHLRWPGEVYRRAILTLHVWGLAGWNETSIPTWRDVHALRWCAWAAKNCGSVDPQEAWRG